MIGRDDETKCEPMLRRLSVAPASKVAARLLERARVQHRDGVEVRERVRSGLPTLDRLAHTWWGLSLLAGNARAGKTTLAARIALETARTGGRVLWFSVDGHAETAVFRLLTGLARVPARSLFVERTLNAGQWRDLAAAAEEVGKLPFSLADAHGATLPELRAAVVAAAEAGPLDLIVIDGLSDADRRLLAGLEALSEEVDSPVLAVTTFCGTLDWQGERDLLRGGLSLRPGSLRLHLSKEEPEEDRAPSEEVPLWVDVYRAGEGFHMSIGLKMLTGCRWIEEVEPG